MWLLLVLTFVDSPTSSLEVPACKEKKKHGPVWSIDLLKNSLNCDETREKKKREENWRGWKKEE